MEEKQRFSIKGRAFGACEPGLQDVLADVYGTPERPRCLCIPGGIDMYVARHGHYLVKRMPETGHDHHPRCPSYEPEEHRSGLGELLGEAILESATGEVELRVDFPWSRSVGRSASRHDGEEPVEIEAARRRMSLRGLLHFLFERAGFNRWTPAMAGKRNQAVLHKYLMAAADGVAVKGFELAQRLFVPEPFNRTTHADAVGRRRAKLALLTPGEGRRPLALVLGEFKQAEPCGHGRRVWIRHMPDAPLLVDHKTWARIERAFASLLEAADADIDWGVHIVMAALIRARREHTYEIDAASLMLTSEHWIPVEGVFELPLIDALVEQQRRFIKPLRYDARSTANFANVLLLDTGSSPTPLHIVSPFMAERKRTPKEMTVAAAKDLWVWHTGQPMPALPNANP